MNKFIVVEEVDLGGELLEDVALPACHEVCPRCQGDGHHSNPSIDGNGISMEEFERDWEMEEREAYFRGDYDVVCERCKGQRVILVVDEDAITTDRERRALEHRRELAEVDRQIRAEEEMERRYCGGW